MWIILFHRDAGSFSSEAEAVERAWELTPAGGVRPRVEQEGAVHFRPAGEPLTWGPAGPGTHDRGGSAHVHINFDGTKFGEALQVQMDQHGRWAVLETERTFVRSGNTTAQTMREMCTADLLIQARAHKLSFDPSRIDWTLDTLHLVNAVRLTGKVTATGE